MTLNGNGDLLGLPKVVNGDLVLESENDSWQLKYQAEGCF